MAACLVWIQFQAHAQASIFYEFSGGFRPELLIHRFVRRSNSHPETMPMPLGRKSTSSLADYLDEASGILVEPIGRERFVVHLAEAMVTLTQSRELGR